MPETFLIMFPQRLVSFQKLTAPKQQLRKINYPFTLTLLFIHPIQFDHSALIVVLPVDIGCAKASFLGAIDEIHEISGRVFLIIDIVCFQQAFDCR